MTAGGRSTQGKSAQLEMSGMPRRLFSATPSKLAAFADCPRRYRFAYVDRPSPPKGPPWAHNTVGSAVHAALRSWWDLPVEKRTTGAARQLLYSAWSQNGFRDAEQSERWRARAAGWLTEYMPTLDPTDEPVGTERTVGATTDRLALSGRVDRIDQRGDELVVVVYKTGRSVCTDDEARGSPALADRVGRLRARGSDAAQRLTGAPGQACASSSARKLHVSRGGAAAWPVGQLDRKSHQLHCTPGVVGKATSGSSPLATASVAAVMSRAMSSARRTWLASDRSVCSNEATVPLGRWCSSTRVHGRRSVRRTPNT